MTRDEHCPLCGSNTDPILQLRFSRKMKLPTESEIRYCASDNFLFLAGGEQEDYNQYYEALANDSYHAEVSGGNYRSPISKLQRNFLVHALETFFDEPKKVLDFGCGEACLLVELASDFPSSTFLGFDLGPAARIGSDKARALNLDNLSITNLKASVDRGPFDLVILSHVMEHLVDFDVLHLLNNLLAKNGLLYVEVPDPLKYELHKRIEFLYYFDRLHVNHFTPQSLARLAARFGFGYVKHFEYAFPYRDGDDYPALGMLFRKDGLESAIPSPSILEATSRYISQEGRRAQETSRQLAEYKGILIWGAGDNFHRSAANGGPLSEIGNMIVLDRRQQEVEVAGRKYETQEPSEGIRRYPWPVVVTVSDRRKSIMEEIAKIDPSRPVFFL